MEHITGEGRSEFTTRECLHRQNEMQVQKSKPAMEEKTIFSFFLNLKTQGKIVAQSSTGALHRLNVVKPSSWEQREEASELNFHATQTCAHLIRLWFS